MMTIFCRAASVLLFSGRLSSEHMASAADATKSTAVSDEEQKGRLERFKKVIRPAVFLQVFNA
jgi:hypothetical protein